jgi:hypothetical protein
MSLFVDSLLERLDEETGISLSKSEVKVELNNDELSVFIWNQLLLDVADASDDLLEDEDFFHEFWELLTEEYYDVREKLIELKLASLNEEYLTALSKDLTPLLQNMIVDKKVFSNVDFTFVDISSADKDYGLPKVGLRITDFENLKVVVPVDIKVKPHQFDAKVIATEFDKKK